MSFYTQLLETYGVNKPIFIEDIKKQFAYDNYIIQKIDYLVKKGNVKRFEKGIIYLPEYVDLGNNKIEVGVNVYDIINSKYIQNNTIGYLGGASLKNMLNFSTQVPNTIEIVSNNASLSIRKFQIKNINIILRKSKVNITEDNASVLMFLELISNLKEEELKDRGNIDKLRRMLLEKKIYLQQLLKYSKYFKNVDLGILGEKEVFSVFTSR